jgi:hypothetical protein
MRYKEIRYATVIEQVMHILPEFAYAYRSQLEGLAQGLPYVIVGLLTDYIIREFKSGNLQDSNTPFFRAIRFLEDAMGSEDEEVRNLVWCSFLENLHNAGADFEKISSLLGEKLQAALKDLA